MSMVTEFKLDIDKAGVDLKRIARVFSMLSIKMSTGNIYDTKNGYHVYIRTDDDYSDQTVCMVQVLCGSDYNRELFNLIRIHKGTSDWNVLFDKKFDKNFNLLSVEKFNPHLTLAFEKLIFDGHI